MNNPPSDGDGSSKSPPRQTPSRTEVVRQFQEDFARRRQAIAAFASNNRPFVHDQIARVTADYDAPYWMSLPLYSREAVKQRHVEHFENQILTLCAGAGRTMNDTEAKATTRILATAEVDMRMNRLSSMALALIFTFRGRKTFRFPFFTPAFKNRLLNPKAGGRVGELAWHATRFLAYSGVVWFVCEPLSAAWIIRSVTAKLRAEPILADFNAERRRHAQQGTFLDGADRNNTSTDFGDPGGQQNGYGNSDYQTEQNQQTASKTDWSSYYQQSYSSPEPPAQQRSSNWDSSPTDNTFEDDASPVTPSYKRRGQTSSSSSYSSGSGSAWDRIRQQSKGPGSSSSSGNEQEAQWGATPQTPSSWDSGSKQNSTWGSESTSKWGNPKSSSNEWGSAGNQQQFGKKDQAKTDSKDRAQRDFDRMLDKERKAGEDGTEGNSWTGRR